MLYVFGYGSLINMAKNTELIQPKKICPVRVKGLKRSLNISGPASKSRVFGVKDVQTANCNGILFKVNATELANLEKREQLYKMKMLAPERIEFYTAKCFKFKPTDKIVCFYPQAKYVLTKKDLKSKPVSPDYLRICTDGAEAISEAFLEDFLAMSASI